MRIYRDPYKKKKKVNVVPVLLIGAVLAAVFLGEQSHDLSGFSRELKLFGYEDVLRFSMPGLFGADETNGLELVTGQLLSHFFLLEKVAKETNYPTQIESDLSYEAILSREQASDENYVDAGTGQVVFAGEISESEMVAKNGTGSEDAAETVFTEDVAGESENLKGNGAAAAAGAVAAGKVVTYSREKLNDFDYLIQNFYQVDSTTTINAGQLNVDALLGKDLRLSHGPDAPQVLIYHTHSQEGYADSIPGDASTSVVGVGDYLAKLLTERYGMNVIHHKGEYDVEDRDHAYSRAGPGLAQVLKENPGIEVVIDLHRDGVAADTRLTTTVDGTEMAQVMFFNGLSRTTGMGDIAYLKNPYIADNLAMSFQMQLKAAEYYPGLTRRIYLKGYRYNMHYCPKTLLIEVGAQTNTVEEAMNAMVPLADLLNKVLTEQQ